LAGFNQKEKEKERGRAFTTDRLVFKIIGAKKGRGGKEGIKKRRRSNRLCRGGGEEGGEGEIRSGKSLHMLHLNTGKERERKRQDGLEHFLPNIFFPILTEKRERGGGRKGGRGRDR